MTRTLSAMVNVFVARPQGGRRRSRGVPLLLAGVLAAGAACAVDSVDPPAPTGPAELGLSLSLVLSRDVMSQDGTSATELSITARDENGQPKAGVSLRVDIMVRDANGAWVEADFGILSNRWPTTASNGVAQVTYQSPPKPALGATSDQVVTLRVTPVGSNYASTMVRTVTVLLMRPGVILGPSRMVPRFIFSPASPREFEDIFFNTAATSDPDQAIVSWEWSLGNGDTRTGRSLIYAYEMAGTYAVILTVTDAVGRRVSTTPVALTVTATVAPTAVFAFSPKTPQVGTPVVFDAVGSTAVPGRRIVGYNWNFGDGTLADGVAPVHAYTSAGQYVVTLSVTDDAGKKGVQSQTVSVSDPARPTPAFTFSPTDPQPGDTVTFNAAASLPSSGRQIVSYTWDFGDGGTATGATASHVFASERTYTVTLTIVDDAGTKAVLAKTVTVEIP